MNWQESSEQRKKSVYLQGDNSTTLLQVPKYVATSIWKKQGKVDIFLYMYEKLTKIRDYML